MEPPTEVFKSSFWKTLGVTMMCSHGISGAIVGGDLLNSDRVTACTLQCVVKAMAWGGIVEVVLIGLAIAYFKIYVHSTGLTLYNLWGKYYDI